MKRKHKVQLRITLFFCVILCGVMSLILHFGENMFTGVKPEDITMQSQIGEVPYSVTNIMEHDKADGTIEYKIHFESPVEDAPAFDNTADVVPIGMTLDAEYMVKWLHVVAVYDVFSREKDILLPEFIGGEITSEQIASAEEQVYDSLMTAVSGIVSPAYTPFAVGVIILNVLCCFAAMRLAEALAEKWLSTDVWVALEEQLVANRADIEREGYFGIDVQEEFKLENIKCPQAALPVKFWDNDEAYAQYVTSKPDIAGNKAVNDNNDLRMTIVEAMQKKKGIIPDMIVSGNEIVSEDNSGLSQMTVIRGNNANKKTETKSQYVMPKSSFNGTKRKAQPPKATGFKSRMNDNVIDDIEI